MGVIAIAQAIPEFNLNVLHQADKDVAIQELNKFLEREGIEAISR